MSRVHRAKVAAQLFSILPPLLFILAFTLIVPIFGRPCLAQTDPTGKWSPRFDEDQMERIPGPEIGDYLGIPINAEGRMRGDTWDAALIELPENQCREHGADYGWRGPSNLIIWPQVDYASQRLIAYHTHLGAYGAEQTIWMDGRSQPGAYAPHTWEGYSTGAWDGDTLVATVTHLKENWFRRNGLDRSDEATVRLHFLDHGNVMTMAVLTYDPVYGTEPFIRTSDFVWNPQLAMAPWPCEPVEEVVRPAGVVPMHLPGQNTFLEEVARRYQIPYDATRGGADTMYPEYIQKMKSMKLLPPLPKKASNQ